MYGPNCCCEPHPSRYVCVTDEEETEEKGRHGRRLSVSDRAKLYGPKSEEQKKAEAEEVSRMQGVQARRLASG